MPLPRQFANTEGKRDWRKMKKAATLVMLQLTAPAREPSAWTHVPSQPLMQSLLSQFQTSAEISQFRRFFRVWRLPQVALGNRPLSLLQAGPVVVAALFDRRLAASTLVMLHLPTPAREPSTWTHAPSLPLTRSLLSQFQTSADISQRRRFFRVWRLLRVASLNRSLDLLQAGSVFGAALFCRRRMPS